jgi:hypothetical protein
MFFVSRFRGAQDKLHLLVSSAENVTHVAGCWRQLKLMEARKIRHLQIKP